MSSNVVHLLNCGKLENKAPVSRPKNKEVRSREYLTLEEAKQLRDAAKTVGRHGQRDYLLTLMMYRHALRVSEACELRWDQVDFGQAKLHVVRKKNGNPSVHDIQGDELRLLRYLKRVSKSAFVFTSERDGGTCPLSRFTVNDIIERAGKLAGFPFKCHPHMLRHAKGYTLAEKGYDTRAIQDYLGHKNVAHTVLYTQLSSKRLKPLSGD